GRTGSATTIHPNAPLQLPSSPSSSETPPWSPWAPRSLPAPSRARSPSLIPAISRQHETPPTHPAKLITGNRRPPRPRRQREHHLPRLETRTPNKRVPRNDNPHRPASSPP